MSDDAHAGRSGATSIAGATSAVRHRTQRTPLTTAPVGSGSTVVPGQSVGGRGPGAAYVSRGSDGPGAALGGGAIVVSVVMPCLDEAGSVGICVRKALDGLSQAGLVGEVLVVDNGSTDGSVAVATAAGARVILEPRRGYGSAYLAGFAAATGRFIVMGDSDDSYDFTGLGALVGPLLAGNADYVLGSRFAGEILPGAMSWSHRRLGNPVLTGLLNWMFGLDSSDAHSGMRAFTREAYLRMGLRCEGMELASELVVAAARTQLRVTEVPITYHPRVGASKLNGLRDGWRHLRFMFLLAPRHLFVLPGTALAAVGLAGQIALLADLPGLGSERAVAHLSVLFALAAVIGVQTVSLGIFADVYNAAQGWGIRLGAGLSRLIAGFTLERGLTTGAALFGAGLLAELGIVTGVLVDARSQQVPPAALALTVMALGTQIAFGAFLLHLLSGRAAGRPVGSVAALAPVDRVERGMPETAAELA
ncbi:MAG: glycosyltransferase family 2 protein [Frankia sp.]